MNPGRRRSLDPTAVELIEEAVHLLRRAPLGWYALYLAGVGPFVTALLFYWAWVTWARPSGEENVWMALGLVPLFLWMKAIQSEFCGRLLALRLDEAPAPAIGRRLGRVFLAQARIQTWVAVLLGPASLALLPFPWVFAYGQSATVIGEGDFLHEEAAAQARLWPAQNCLGLLLIGSLAACLTLNIAACFYTIPWLCSRVLGIETIFSLHGWSLLNTTFLASVAALGWAASDPLVKAFYVLRVFHGRSLRTGEDLRIELRRTRRVAALAAIGLALALTEAARPLDAAPASADRPAAVRPQDLDRAVDTVLSRADYAWRIHTEAPAADDPHEGWFARFVRTGLRVLGNMLGSLIRAIGSIIDWIMGRFGRPSPGAVDSAGSAAGALAKGLLYVFAALALAALGWLVWLAVGRFRESAPRAAVVTPLAAEPDLASEDLHADRLPPDGWLALAREQAARGEWRLAQRALYLALLASLAAEGLISLARFKTNLDYERELRGRALSRGEVPARFSIRRREFEESWYGRAVPTEDAVRVWLAELEAPPSR
jgi:hypothetical protein